MKAPRRLIGRLAPAPTLVATVVVITLIGMIAYVELRPGAPAPRHMGFLILVLMLGAWGILSMLLYVANLLLAGGYGVYERGGRIIHRFPFLTSVRLEDVTGVGLGTNFAFKDAPDYIYLAVKGGRQVKIHTGLFKTPYQEMIATLEALGVPCVPGKDGKPESLP